MPASVFDFTLAQFRNALAGTQIILEEADRHIRASGQSPDGLLEARLQADMLPLAFQIGQAVNSSAGALRRIKGESVTALYVFDDFSAARAGIADALAYCKSVDASEFSGMEERAVIWTAPKIELRYTATEFLVTHAIPNFYFHCAAIYCILRTLGVPIGKLNFLGRSNSRQEAGPRGAALAALEAMAAKHSK